MGKHADKDLTGTSVIRKQQKHFSYQLRILDPATHATNLNPCLVTFHIIAMMTSQKTENAFFIFQGEKGSPPQLGLIQRDSSFPWLVFSLKREQGCWRFLRTNSNKNFFADTGSAVKSELYIRLERLTKVFLHKIFESNYIEFEFHLHNL